MESPVPKTNSAVVDLNEAWLIRRVKEGDVEAFGTLYREHVKRVYAICLRITADPDTAEELTQDVFVRVWQRIGQYEGRSKFSTWLHRIAAKRSLDLEAAIARLPEAARAVFVLHDVEGYRHEEIARMTGIAEGTSKSQLHRARRILRERL
jgi:RNA polymerase sigma-70 factor (ECF subfamily)